MKVTLKRMTVAPEEIIAEAAALCYASDPKDCRGMIRHLYRCHHHSPFEHTQFTFLIEGISRACSHQLVRHRHMSPTQRSQRYCLEDGFEFVVPDNATNNDTFLAAMENAQASYNALIADGVPNEDARAVLPNACTTKLMVTVNLRELIHMCNFRLCARAQKEIRDVVASMRALVPEEFRWMLVPKCLAPYYNCLERRTEACQEVRSEYCAETD